MFEGFAVLIKKIIIKIQTTGITIVKLNDLHISDISNKHHHLSTNHLNIHHIMAPNALRDINRQYN